MVCRKHPVEALGHKAETFTEHFSVNRVTSTPNVRGVSAGDVGPHLCGSLSLEAACCIIHSCSWSLVLLRLPAEWIGLTHTGEDLLLRSESIDWNVDLILEDARRNLHRKAGHVGRHRGTPALVYKTVNEKIPENKLCLQRPVKTSVTVEFGLFLL